MTEQQVREIAWIAWKGAANAHRLYPDNNHTFTYYWDAAKSQFDSYITQSPEVAKESLKIAEAVEFAEWLADVNINGYKKQKYHEIELVDGEYYWNTDKDGDQPISPQHLYELFKQSKE